MFSLSASLSGFLNQLGEPVELFLRESRSFVANECRQYFLRGPAEKRFHQMLKCRLPHGMAGNSRRVDESLALGFVADVALLLEYAQLCAHRRVIGISSQFDHYVVGGGSPPAIQNVHDLPLSTAEFGMQCICHADPYI